jgi:predicted nuclease of predicted toxin-antitoxin system
MAELPAIRFFIDHCVPDSAAGVLRDAGYEVTLLRERIAPTSPDPLVAAVSEMHGAVLVSLDSDFKRLAPRVPVGQRQRFRRLSRIGLRCRAPQCARRLKACLSLIAHEWMVAQASADKRMIVEIGESYVRSIR